MLFKVKLYETIKKNPTTISRISRDTKISRFTLHRWMNDTMKQVDVDKVEKLCNYFGVELKDMLEIVDSEEEKSS